MIESVFQQLIQLEHVGFVLFGIILLCGLGLPMPEDVVIITAGYLVYLGRLELYSTMAFLWAGAIGGDLMLHSIGKKFGPSILTNRYFKHFFSQERTQRIQRYFDHYGSSTLFFARFLAGLRAPIYLSSGVFKVPFYKMALLDGAAGLLSIPLLTYLAYRFGEQIQHLLQWVRKIEYGILAAAILFIVWMIVKSRWKKKP